MKKQLLSILLCLIMVVGLLPTAVLAEETAPTFDLTKDLAGITIPDDLVTCICTTTNESKKYGQLPGGFSASKIEKEYDVWTVIISVKNKTYLEQFNQDMDCEHGPDLEYSTDIIDQIQFKLKYEGGKWELLGEMPKNKMLHFTCGGGHVYQGDIPVIKLVTRTYTDIKVTENNNWEYSKDKGETWQGSCHFTNLQPGTEYTIIARVKETATHQPSANSEPLTVTTMHIEISEELKKQLRAVASGYEGEYDGMEHEAVIVDMRTMPEGWSIAGHTAGTGDDFVSQIPKIRNVSGSNLTVKTKFTHPDYGQSLIVYSYPKITPKPLTADMIADIPPQRYTGQSIYPMPGIKDGDMDLVEGTDFTYSYDTNTSPEQGGKVTITGNGNYKGMASKNFSIVNEITEITEDDLKDLEIPTLVTVKCTTTNSSKEYGKIPGGFTLGKPYMEKGVLKAIVYLNLPAYKDKYDADTGKTHENAEGEGNPHAAFTLKYVKNKWELDGSFPAVVLLVTCNGSHENQTYTVTFDGNGGVPSFIRMDTIDQKLSELPTATHSGRYSFDGWYTEKNGGTKITTATLFDKDTTVYAHWTYTGGTGDGKFSPDATCTRAQAVTFLYRASGSPAVSGNAAFTDVAADAYYAAAVTWAEKNGITGGIGGGLFGSGQSCTRGQIVTFLYRARNK